MRERKELREKIRMLKERIRAMEGKKKKEEREEEGKNVGGRIKENEIEGKVKELEKWRELEERERRRKNVVIKGLELKEGGIGETVNKLWREIGVQAEIEEVKEINKRKEGGRRMVLVRMRDREG